MPVKWLFLSRPVDWLVGVALRLRAAHLGEATADDPDDIDGFSNATMGTSTVAQEEIVARAIDPADWRGFDTYVRRLGLDAGEQAAARTHHHGPIRLSLHRARAAITALDEFRKGSAGTRN